MAKSLMDVLKQARESALPVQNPPVLVEPTIISANIDQSEALALVDEKPVESLNFNNFGFGTIEGEVGLHSISFPRLSIAQSVGEVNVRNGWMAGSIVLRQEVKIAEPKEVVHFTVLKLKNYLEENLPYDPSKPVRKFESIEEAAAAGLSLMKETVRPVTNIYILLECPKESLQHQFPLTFSGKQCTLAFWTVRKTAYYRVAQPILTELAYYGHPLLSRRWKLSAQVEKVGKGMIGVPSIAVVSINTPEEVDLMQKKIINPSGL
jgi:hypothetical protein